MIAAVRMMPTAVLVLIVIILVLSEVEEGLLSVTAPEAIAIHATSQHAVAITAINPKVSAVTLVPGS